ncbi:MAG: Methyltransferase family protein [Segetibacter sp.]|nr:Methyltransferase family protein [Segetibacter sp.]
MISQATESAKMPVSNSSVLDSRNLQNDYSTLTAILTPGLRVLDVGCGTGAITSGIAAAVGENGFVVGIDSSAHLVAKGKEDFKNIPNLQLVEVDLFNYYPEEKFDLIVAARVLQWLPNPKEAIIKCKELLKPNGRLSVLDYNHTELEWDPAPPESMQKFYQAFLNWRLDEGMNNQIAEDLPPYFRELGLQEIEVFEANEVYKKGETNFIEKAGIWSIVAHLRGPQMVETGYIPEFERLQAIEEYDKWIQDDAELMTMKLKETRGRIENRP